MSFLNSVLSSIGGASGQPQPPRPASATPSSAAKAPAVPRREASSNGSQPAAAAKRKAEGEQDPLRAKVARKDSEAVASRPAAAARAVGSAAPGKQQSSTTSVPYRGTAQPTGSVGTIRKTAPQKPSVNTAALSATQKQTPKPATPTSATGSGAPKKGSYADILARAAAAQQAAKPVGVITHKPVEKQTKKDRLAQAADAKSKQPVGKERAAATKGGSRTPEPTSAKGKPAQPAKEKKKAADLGYTGTMRAAPKEPAYSGTMRSGSAKPLDRSRSFDRSRSASLAAKPKGRYERYASEDDAEEEEDFDSGSSDMEAGAFDLDEEEQRSLRMARKEDEEALKEEEAAKRKKLDRKSMLAKMAANAASKKRY